MLTNRTHPLGRTSASADLRFDKKLSKNKEHKTILLTGEMCQNTVATVITVVRLLNLRGPLRSRLQQLAEMDDIPKSSKYVITPARDIRTTHQLLD